eukprot:scaffold31086_cov27-Tisochrysis_lutea.AAC.1
MAREQAKRQKVSGGGHARGEGGRGREEGALANLCKQQWHMPHGVFEHRESQTSKPDYLGRDVR